MDCHEVQQALIDASYDKLPAPVRRAVAAHRAACGDCDEVWTSLHAVHVALDQWHDVAPPADLHARVLTRVAAARSTAATGVGWRRGLVHTGLSVGAGLAMMALTMLLLSPWLPLEAVTPRVLVICGALWGGAYIGLYRLALSEAGWRPWPGGFGRSQIAGAAGVAVVALGMATVFVAVMARLPVVAALSSLLSPLWLTIVGSGTLALLALLVSTAGLGYVLGPRSLMQALLAACLFLVAAAPGLLMVCVPFTLGAAAGVLLAVGLGAGAGGALGTWLCLHRPAHVRG